MKDSTTSTERRNSSDSASSSSDRNLGGFTREELLRIPRTEKHLSQLRVKELRTIARDACGPGTWISHAKKSDLIEGAVTGEPPRSLHERYLHSDYGRKGFVYVLENGEFVKVGHTFRSASERAEEVSSRQDVSVEYEVVREIETVNPKAVERKVVSRLSEYRVCSESRREFFEVNPKEAIRAVAEAVQSIAP